MTCPCCPTAAEHEASEREAKATNLIQFEAERRVGMAFHCPECVREARGELAAEECRLCPPGRHRICEAHI